MSAFTVSQVASAVFGSDACPLKLKRGAIQTVAQIILQVVLGRHAAFSEDGQCRVDLGNGFVLCCTVKPVEEAE